MCDKDLRVIFYGTTCDGLDKKTNTCALSDFRENNIYIIDIMNLHCNDTCLNAFNEDLGFGIDGWVIFLLISYPV